MSKKSWAIKRYICLCLLLMFPLCSAAEEETVKVTIVDSLMFQVDEPSCSVPYGGDVSFRLTMRAGYTVASCSYEDYAVSGQDGIYTLTLHHVTRPGRVTVTASAAPQEANTNPTFTCAIRYIFNDGTVREKTEEYTLSYGNVAFAWTITLLLFTLSNLSFLLRDNPFSGTSATDIFYIRTLSDIVGVVMGQMFHLQKCDTERREENAAFQTVLRNQYIQFRESKDNIEMINRKYHDLKHQLQILRETSNDEERSTYIDEIQQGIERYEAENKTGNNVLDTVLASKQSRCLNENITMTVVADGTLINRLSVMDICTIFGNALDNAIEYELKVKEQEKRLIHVTLAEKNGFACILVENYYEGSAISKGSLPETTKHNKKYHGFGLRSVKYTCEKYGGYINTSVRDGWFRLEMIIPKA